MPDYTFYDDFDGPAGSAPDSSKWVYDTGAGGWGNNELETYTTSRANSYLDGNSNLVIAVTQAQGKFYSARLKTLGTFQQLGGSFEARIKIESQPGIWPAFWLMGGNITAAGWPQCGEVDIAEDFGFNTVQSSVHAPKGSATYDQSYEMPGDSEWHVYRADVTQEGITFYRDGYEYGHTPVTYCPPEAWIFGPKNPNNGGMFFLLNVAVGGRVGPPPASTKLPAIMQVDYVRAWR